MTVIWRIGIGSIVYRGLTAFVPMERAVQGGCIRASRSSLCRSCYGGLFSFDKIIMAGIGAVKMLQKWCASLKGAFSEKYLF